MGIEEIIHYLAAEFRIPMKQILSEKNIAGLLFILVMVAFSLAHEDSKKRSDQYNVSTPSITSGRSTVHTETKNFVQTSGTKNSVFVK